MGEGEIPNTPEHQIETSGAPHGQEITLDQFFLWLPGRTQRAVDEHLRSRHRGETRRPDKIANFKKICGKPLSLYILRFPIVVYVMFVVYVLFLYMYRCNMWNLD